MMIVIMVIVMMVLVVGSDGYGNHDDDGEDDDDDSGSGGVDMQMNVHTNAALMEWNSLCYRRAGQLDQGRSESTSTAGTGLPV